MAGALAEAGAAVVLVARREAELARAAQQIRERNGEAISISADLSARDQLPDIAERCRRAFGPVAIVVNAAGINLREPAEEISPASWDRTIDLNLAVPFFFRARVHYRNALSSIRTHHQYCFTAVFAGFPQWTRLRRIQRRRLSAHPRHGGGVVRSWRHVQCDSARLLSHRADGTGLLQSGSGIETRTADSSRKKWSPGRPVRSHRVLCRPSFELHYRSDLAYRRGIHRQVVASNDSGRSESCDCRIEMHQ